MTSFALFVGVFYKMSSYEIYLPQLIEMLPICQIKYDNLCVNSKKIQNFYFMSGH